MFFAHSHKAVYIIYNRLIVFTIYMKDKYTVCTFIDVIIVRNCTRKIVPTSRLAVLINKSRPSLDNCRAGRIRVSLVTLVDQLWKGEVLV